MTAKLIRILLTALACLVPSSALHCQDAKALERNLAEARAAIKAKDYTGARLSAKAALLVDESSQEAFILLSDAYAGLNQKDDAIKAALDTVDAPAKGNKNAAGFTGRAVKTWSISSRSAAPAHSSRPSNTLPAKCSTG